ncbi:protein delta homolog 2 isoform X2 [Paroedura picta]|uniref:protein delta homolog 2 isoform X2 n=1 Tax=Paroedura picta TaxID=143630 RepID=UPI004055C280
MLRSFCLQLMSLLWILVAHHHFAQDVHICEHENPCQNGAQCVYDRDGEYSCLCLEGFHGKDCELKTGPCEKAGFPCKNGGLCQDKNGFASNYTCKCLAGFIGAHCEIDVDDCLMRPCANGATCLDGINRFSCQCQAGFEGRFCTINIDDCVSQPCRNGAKCYDRIDDFDCLCPDGFVGKTCELLAPEPTWVTTFQPDQNGVAKSTTDSDLWTTQSEPVRIVVTGRRITDNSEKPNGGGLLISVKEVVTQQDSGLSQSQLILVLVFGLFTVVLVLVTVLLLLKNWQRGRQRCQSPTQSARKLQDQECQVGMLSTILIEPRKTTEL